MSYGADGSVCVDSRADEVSILGHGQGAAHSPWSVLIISRGYDSIGCPSSGFGFSTGDGTGDGFRYAEGFIFGDGSGDGFSYGDGFSNGSGDGYGYSYGYGVGGGYGFGFDEGFGELDGTGSVAHRRWFVPNIIG